jgi:hypothetical protein
MKRTMKLKIPHQLELLCSLWETTPEEVTQGFINDVSQSQASNGSDERWMSAEYLLRCCYYMSNFDYDQAQEMIAELNEIRRERYNFDNGQEAMYRKHSQKQLKAWNKKWEQVKTDNQQKNATIASNNL